jgi:fructokinase
MTSRPLTVVGIGESLFDLFGSDARLGGAPLNVAVHAHQILKPHGGRGIVISRVGDDPLGQQIRRELRDRGMTLDGLQVDSDHPTGRVTVKRNEGGGHAFQILNNQAYDWLQPDPELETIADVSNAVAFGSLAQRNAQSRQTIRRVLQRAKAGGATLLFDVNLRASGDTPFYDADILKQGCLIADYVKLNDEELETVNRLTLTRDADDLLKTFDLEAVIFTRGKDGTAAYTADGLVEGDPATIDDADPEADTVGAGDSCTAAFLAATLMGHPLPDALTLANRVAAYVANQVGATPTLPQELLAAFGPG